MIEVNNNLKVDESLLVAVDVDQRIHCLVLDDYVSLQQCASEAGFDLRICSGYRSVDRQTTLWQRKAQARIDAAECSDEEICLSIIRWSAIPGFSRHHWGSDFDIYDHRALPSDNYDIQLSVEEVTGDGHFAPMHSWLDYYLSQPGCPFFRPYTNDIGGIHPERWHLSHKTIAATFESQLSFENFQLALSNSRLLLSDTLRNRAEFIYQNFVLTNLTRDGV